MHAKNIVCILFDLNMVNLAQQNLISPFCNHEYFITAAHNRFQCKVFELSLTLFVKDFFKFQSETVTSSDNKESLKISRPCR